MFVLHCAVHPPCTRVPVILVAQVSMKEAEMKIFSNCITCNLIVLHVLVPLSLFSLSLYRSFFLRAPPINLCHQTRKNRFDFLIFLFCSSICEFKMKRKRKENSSPKERCEADKKATQQMQHWPNQNALKKKTKTKTICHSHAITDCKPRWLCISDSIEAK